MPMVKLARALFIGLALVLGTAQARAETVNCTAITTLPAIIVVQGSYCFTGNLATAVTSGNVIDIQTNNVVLDLNGFKLGGLAAGLGTNAVGIHAANRQNIDIKNGTIRGFFQGILLTDSGASQGHVIEDIRADQSTSQGINVAGTGVIIRNNQVVATGGTTLGGGNANAFGIAVSGSGARVLNNDVINTVKQGTGSAAGIFLASVTGGMVVNNRITVADIGIDCTTGGSTGMHRDNLTFGVTTSVTGCTFAMAYGYFYALMLPDNPAPLAAGFPVDFPHNGAASGIVRSSPSTFILPAIGVYEVSWQASVDQPGQLILGLDSGLGVVEQPDTVVGRATGTSQIMNQVLLTTTALNSILTVRNPTGNIVALTVTPSAGGTHPVSASLVIKQIQ